MLPPSGPLKFAEIEVLGPLQKTTIGRKYFVVIMYRYSKMTRGVPTTKTTVVNIAYIFPENGVMPFGIRNICPYGQRNKFAGKFFSALYRYLGINELETTAYHPKTNGPTERYNKNVAAILRHYVAEHHFDWYIYVQTFTY